MNFKENFKEQVGPLVQIEQKARDMYGYYIDRVQDPILLAKLKEIHEDEEKHVEIAKSIIDLLS